MAPSGPEWIHELKYDGYRIGAIVAGARVRLESRREIDWTARFPEVVEAVRQLGCRSAVIDGEVAITEASGRTSFQRLQNIFEKGGGRGGLTYYVFDLLELDDTDLTKLPLEQRKALLEKLVDDGDSLSKYSRHFEGDGPHILEHACRLGCEGIVSKRRGDRYRTGRSESWLKTKCVQRREFVIGGYTDPEGSRTGIGSLLLGLTNDADELVFAGGVGTGKGFTADYLAEVRRGLVTIEQAECPFAQLPPADVVKRAIGCGRCSPAKCRSSNSPKKVTLGIRAFWAFALRRGERSPLESWLLERYIFDQRRRPATAADHSSHLALRLALLNGVNLAWVLLHPLEECFRPALLGGTPDVPTNFVEHFHQPARDIRSDLVIGLLLAVTPRVADSTAASGSSREAPVRRTLQLLEIAFLSQLLPTDTNGFIACFASPFFADTAHGP